jgi:hypothetical protein
MRKTPLVGSFVVIACRLTLWSDAIRPPNGTDRTAAASVSSTTPPISAVTRPVPAPRAPAPSALASLDCKHGVRDVTFGDPPTADMVLKADAGGAQYYIRPHDNLSLDGAPWQSMAYG